MGRLVGDQSLFSSSKKFFNSSVFYHPTSGRLMWTALEITMS